MATVDRPDGPAATLAGPLTAGSGISLVAGRSVDLAAADFVEEEYTAEGTADVVPVRRRAADRRHVRADRGRDGRLPHPHRRPAPGQRRRTSTARSSSSGSTSAAAFDADARLRLHGRRAAARRLRLGGRVGPADRHRGRAGRRRRPAAPPTTSPARGSRRSTPRATATLAHPGDAFAYDIYTQVGRALRAGDGATRSAGSSPSGCWPSASRSRRSPSPPTSNGVQPLTLAYDGFLVHSRGGAAAPLGAPGEGIDIAGTIGGEPTRIRTDLDAPVLVVETETDVRRHPRLLPGPPGRHRHGPAVGGRRHGPRRRLPGRARGRAHRLPRPDQRRAAALRRQGGAAPASTPGSRDGTAPPEASRLEIDDSGAVARDRARRRRHRRRRHPHPAGRRARRRSCRATPPARPRSSACCSARPRR